MCRRIRVLPRRPRPKVQVSRIFGRLCQKSMTEFDTTHRVLPRRKKKFPGEFLVVYVKWSCPIIRGIPRTSATKSPVSRTCWSTGHLGEFADSPGLTRLKVQVSRIFGRLCQKSMTEFDTTHRVDPRRKKKIPGEFLVVYVKSR